MLEAAAEESLKSRVQQNEIGPGDGPISVARLDRNWRSPFHFTYFNGAPPTRGSPLFSGECRATRRIYSGRERESRSDPLQARAVAAAAWLGGPAVEHDAAGFVKRRSVDAPTALAAEHRGPASIGVVHPWIETGHRLETTSGRASVKQPIRIRADAPRRSRP